MSVKLEAGHEVAPSATGRVFGIANIAFADNEYGWVQTKGLVSGALANTGVAQYALLQYLAATGSKVQATAAVAEGGAASHAAGAAAVRGQAQTAESGGVADVYLF
jgi:hypothetical protein